MEAVKAFNAELCSLYELKPPVSKAKMTQITKTAMKAIKFYKHVVQSVEKFIQKCRPEYKVPGLYVIDSIIRQSRKLFGPEKDVFAARFSKNIVITFTNLFACPSEDLSRIIRVLNLWQKNGVYSAAIVQPLLDLSADPHSSSVYERVQKEIESVTGLAPSMPLTRCDQKPPALTADALQLGTSLETKPDNHMDLLRVVAQLMQPPVSTPQPVVTAQSVQLQLIQQLLVHQTQIIPEQTQPVIDSSMLTQLQDLAQQILGSNITEKLDPEIRRTEHPSEQSFDKKLLESDYGESDDETGRKHSYDCGSQRSKDLLEESNDRIESSNISEHLNLASSSHQKADLEPEETGAENDGGVEVTGREKSSFEQEDGECTSEEEEVTAGKETELWKDEELWQRRHSDSTGLDDSLSISKNSHVKKDYLDSEESNDSIDQKKEDGRQTNDTDDNSSENYEHLSVSDGRCKESQRQSSDDDCIILDSSSSSSMDEHLRRRRRKHRRRSRDSSTSLRSKSRSSSRERSCKLRRIDDHRYSSSESEEQSAERLKAKKMRERESQGLPPLKENHMSICSTTIWIGHLSKQTTEDDLQDELCKYGEATINLIPPRGCAFVCFNTRKEALKALEMLKGVKIAGNTLKVAWAPGVGIKESAFRKQCDIELGVTYIPWIKIPGNIEPLLDGGVLDEDSLPPGFHSHSEKSEVHFEMDLSQDSAEDETFQQSVVSSSDVSGINSVLPAQSSVQCVADIPPILPPPMPLLAPHLIMSTPVIPTVGIGQQLVMPFPQPLPSSYTQSLIQPLPSGVTEESTSFTPRSHNASDASTSIPPPASANPMTGLVNAVPGLNENISTSFTPASTWMSTAFSGQSLQATPVASFESRQKPPENRKTSSVVAMTVTPPLSAVAGSLPAIPNLVQQLPCPLSSNLPEFDPTKPPPPFFMEQHGHPKQFGDYDSNLSHGGRSKSNDNMEPALNFSETSHLSGFQERKADFVSSFTSGFSELFGQECKLNTMPFQSSNLRPTMSLNQPLTHVNSERPFKEFESKTGFEPTAGMSGSSNGNNTIETSKGDWLLQTTLPDMTMVRGNSMASFGTVPMPYVPLSNGSNMSMPQAATSNSSLFSLQGFPIKEPLFVQDSAKAEGRRRELPSDVHIYPSPVGPVPGNSVPGLGEFQQPRQNILQGPSDLSAGFPRLPIANEQNRPFGCKPTGDSGPRMNGYNERFSHANEQIFPRKTIFNSDVQSVQPQNVLPGPRVQMNFPGMASGSSGSERFGIPGNVDGVMSFVERSPRPRHLADTRSASGPQGMACPGPYTGPVNTAGFDGMPSSDNRADQLAGTEQRQGPPVGFGGMAGIACLTGPGNVGTPSPFSVTGPLGPERMTRTEDSSRLEDNSSSQFLMVSKEHHVGRVPVAPAAQSPAFPFTKSLPRFQLTSPLQSPRIFASRFESMCSQKPDFQFRNMTEPYCSSRITNDNQPHTFLYRGADQRRQDPLQNRERNSLTSAFGNNSMSESSAQFPLVSWPNQGSGIVAEHRRNASSLPQMRYEDRLQLPQPASFTDPRFFQPHDTERSQFPSNPNTHFLRNSLGDVAETFSHRTNHNRTPKEQS